VSGVISHKKLDNLPYGAFKREFMTMKEEVLLQIKLPVNLYILSVVGEALNKVDANAIMEVSYKNKLLTFYWK